MIAAKCLKCSDIVRVSEVEYTSCKCGNVVVFEHGCAFYSEDDEDDNSVVWINNQNELRVFSEVKFCAALNKHSRNMIMQEAVVSYESVG